MKVQMRSDEGKKNKDNVLKEAWDLTRTIYYQVNLSLSLSLSPRAHSKKLCCVFLLLHELKLKIVIFLFDKIKMIPNAGRDAAKLAQILYWECKMV